MNIRTVNVSDAEQVLAFLREFRSEGLQTVLQHSKLPTLEEERSFIGKLSGKAGVMFLALKGEQIVGCLTAETPSHRQLGHSCEFGMGVLSKHRGEGIGSALITRLSEWAASFGLRRIELKVLARNTDAIRLYRRLGYEVEGERKGAVKIGNYYEDLVEMGKRI